MGEFLFGIGILIVTAIGVLDLYRERRDMIEKLKFSSELVLGNESRAYAEGVRLGIEMAAVEIQELAKTPEETAFALKIAKRFLATKEKKSTPE